jgi:cobalt-zinc-cadmium efflux system outer membrane protein
MRAALLAVGLAALAACAPSRSTLFDPVAHDVDRRIGARPAWHRGDADPGRDPEVRRLLGAPLTADAAAAIALRASSHLQASFEELALRGADVATATVPVGPELEASVRSNGHRTIELGAMQDLRDLLLAPAKRGAASAEVEASRRRAVRAAIAIAASARTAFYELAAAERGVRLQRRIVEATDAGAELAQALHAAGNVTDLALVRERAFVAQARIDLVAAEAAARDRRERLNAILGLSGEDAAWRIAEELAGLPAAPPATDELEQKAIEQSLELAELRFTMEGASKRVGIARWSALLPEIAVGVSAEREDGEWSVGPAAALTVPLGDIAGGSRGRGWAELRRSQHLYRARAVDVRAAARSARARLIAAHARAVQLEKEVLPLRAQIVEQTLLQYNAMNATPFELLLARQEQIAAERAHVDAVRDYWIAQAAVDQLLAGATPGAAPDLTTIAAPAAAADAH